MVKGFNPMQQVKALQEKMAKVQEELASKTVETTAGGGMVTVVFNGRQELLSLKIDPQVIDPEDVDMLQDLVLAALNIRSGYPGIQGQQFDFPGRRIPRSRDGSRHGI